MALDLGLLWRATAYGAAVRAILNLGGRLLLSYPLDRALSLPISGLLALLAGAYFVYHHVEQDLLPSLVGGALIGGLAIVGGLFVAYRFSFRWLGPIGDGPIVIGMALVAGAIGGLSIRVYRRARSV